MIPLDTKPIAPIYRILDYTTWPDMTKEEWLKVLGIQSAARGFGKINTLLNNWVAYGIAHKWITLEEIQKVLEEIQ